MECSLEESVNVQTGYPLATRKRRPSSTPLARTQLRMYPSIGTLSVLDTLSKLTSHRENHYPNQCLGQRGLAHSPPLAWHRHTCKAPSNAAVSAHSRTANEAARGFYCSAPSMLSTAFWKVTRRQCEATKITCPGRSDDAHHVQK
jgi:hypothetical protein